MSFLAEWTPANRAAAAALAASAVLCAATIAEARRIDPLPAAAAPAAPVAMPEVSQRRTDASDAQILSAVARDPFRADRRRPPGRYRLPGQEAPASAATSVMPPAQPEYGFTPQPIAPAFRLLGTVVLQDGRGLAALESSGESRVLRVGEEMDGFRVVRVTSGTATLTDGDTTLVLKTEGGAP